MTHPATKMHPETGWLAQETGLGDPKAWRVFPPNKAPHYITDADMAASAWLDMAVVEPPPEQ